MDSVTQAALGSAIGYAVAGRRHGWKAAAAGAVCGSLPDLDVLISYGDPIADYAEHRGFTHSLFWLTLAAPAVALMMALIFRTAFDRLWMLGMWLVLATHPILDAFTVYGTRLWLPFSSEPVLWATIFIIDPLYTLPLIVGVVIALRRYRPRGTRIHSRAPLWALGLTCVYLAWSVVAKVVVDGQIKDALAQEGFSYTRYISTPIFFNTLFWRAVVMTPDGYYEGYIRVFSNEETQWRYRTSRTDLIAELESSKAFRQLQWFSRGFYRIRVQDDSIVVGDLRMGVGDALIFQFIVGDIGPRGITLRSLSERVRSDYSQILSE
ncbi:metal-dependent hydrolase [Thioalkalivibrio sp. HK1]|uniref:metal-dependent hydrolase n=1 Tax=Thioalkalivibrio sp. HK1 TaxID=1469245 RepID=UPI000471480C|nr:metal-dependent hydrolase [Thioalkalivibrio sp. HK1]